MQKNAAQNAAHHGRKGLGERHVALARLDIPRASEAAVPKICKTGCSARVRDVPESKKDEAYARYHLKRVAYAYEVDHLVSLELGGSNALVNLWSITTGRGGLARRIGSRTRCTRSSARANYRSPLPSVRRRRTGSRHTSGTSRAKPRSTVWLPGVTSGGLVKMTS